MLKKVHISTQLPMFQEDPSDNLKVLFGRAFLMELEKDDLEMALLFARAFLIRALMNGSMPGNAS